MPDAPGSDALRAARREVLAFSCYTADLSEQRAFREYVEALVAAARADGAAEAGRALALTAGFLEHVADGYRDLARFENERGEAEEATEWLARAAQLDEWRRDEIGPLLRARARSSGTEAQKNVTYCPVCASPTPEKCDHA